MTPNNMHQETVKCNTSGEIIIPHDIYGGLRVVLIDEKNIPVASYEFDCHQLGNIRIIIYTANNVRIKFEGIMPSMISELIAG